MKLRTEMVGPDSTSDRPYPANSAGDDFQDYLHDAAAAHAYQLAIKSWWDFDDNGQIADAAMSWIEQRADEIMREWGYDDAGQGAEV